jgi:hypothetical protein
MYSIIIIVRMRVFDPVCAQFKKKYETMLRLGYTVTLINSQ